MPQNFYPPPAALPPGSQVVGYLRDSGGTNQEDSVERQEEELRRWCAQYGLDLVYVYVDRARTARRDIHKRKDLLSMMIHFREGGGEAGVIVWNYERFARNIKHGRAFISELEALNKVFVSLTDYIPDGPEKFLFQDMKLYAAQSTSAKISIDVTSGLRRLVQTYGGMPGTPPRGFRRGPVMDVGTHRDGTPRQARAWEPDPEQIGMVRKAFELRARGASLPLIQKETGLYKSDNSWGDFFSNPLYKGILEYGDLTIEDYCEPIISPELWDAANLVNYQRGRARMGQHNPRRVGSEYLFSGLVFCQICGAPMNGHTIKNWQYYACSRRQRRHDCPARMLPRDSFEVGVVEALIEQALTLENMLAMQGRLQAAFERVRTAAVDETVELNRKLKACRKEITNLVAAVKKGTHSRSILDALGDAEAQETEIRLQLAALEEANQPPPTFEMPTLSRMAEAITRTLRHGETDARRFILRNLITRIIARREEATVTGVVYYIAPQQITLTQQGEGNYVYGQVPPRRFELRS